MLPFQYEKKIETIILKLSFQNKIYEIPAEKDITAKELRQGIFANLKLNDSFVLTYKNHKITKNDFTPLNVLFNNDSNPLLFINDNNTILPNLKSTSTISLYSNLSQQKLLNIINLFFLSKNIPFNASIKNSAKGIYNIKFNNQQISSEFLNYYKRKLYIIDKTHENFSIPFTGKNINRQPIRINKTIKLPFVKIKNKNRTIHKNSSKSEIVSRNDKSLSIYNVIKENSKSDLLSQKIIESGINMFRQSKMRRKDDTKNKKTNSNDIRRRFYLNEKYLNNDYEAEYLGPFMSEEEKYYRDKFLDKKNWINKKGFIVSVGKYTMKKNNFIPNYVNATPSEPPLNHKYREVDKNKWINKSGFIV